MTQLHISADLALPIDYVTKTAAILAQRRKGKTYTASVIAEELVDAGQPFVVLDPTGAWWGLRASADADSPGLPVTILGGEHGDVPLERTDGKGVAELVVDEPGWYILDLSLFESNAAEVQFAAEFGQRLYRRKGQPNSDFPMHLFVDEADRFVPQKPRSEKGQGSETTMLGAFEAIVRRGGLRGLGTTLISQRSAVVNKNVLEQADLFIILRTVGPNDRKRIEEIVSAEGTKEQIAELKASMASLDLGEAWIWEPGEALFVRTRIRQRRTFNSSATPKPGAKRVEPRQLASVDLEAIKDRWSAQLEKVKADDPKELRKRIRELERDLAEARAATPQPTVEEVVVEVVPVGFHEALERIEGRLRDLDSSMDDLIALRGLLQATPHRPGRANRKAPIPPADRQGDRGETTPAPARPARPAPRPADTGALPGPQRKLLTVLATYGPRSKRQLALTAGYSMTGGGFNNPLGALRSSGLVERGDPIVITQAGLDALGDYEPLPSGRALLEHWLQQLPGPASKILAAVADRWPDSYTKDELAAATGYSPVGGGFNNPLGRLRTLELITRGTDIRLTDDFGKAIR